MSELVYPSDPGLNGQAVGAAEQTYEANGFDPATEDTRLSYTPCRVAKPSFNTYRRSGSQTVSGFLDTKWAYDGRLTEAPGSPTGGPGADLARLDAASGAFDEIVLGLTGIVGDQGVLAAAIAQAAADFGFPSAGHGTVTFTDAWSSVAAYHGYGFDGWVSNDYPALFDQQRAQGLLGAASRLKASDPALTVGLHIGGWDLSQAFPSIASDPAARQRFAQSVVRIFRAFPMFSALHLDWRWPGSPGAPDTDYGPEDPANYAELIRETRQALSAAGHPTTIAVAVPAIVGQLKDANVPLLVDAGADRLDLMSFDLFGSPWSPGLGHHAPLRRDPNGSQPCIDDAVTYLVSELGVDSRRIHLGYATTTRNAQRARLDNVSPLRGTYVPGTNGTIGSFEPGVSHFADVLRNYLDLENGRGRNGFELYTDASADADFLHNPASGVHLSLDTPRSVRAKAEYARERDLGGLFAEHAAADPGVLTNAAREGLGHTLTATTVDMKPLYVTGRTRIR
ncbi:glycosyl hydrolase family 18 protein [Kitasatospora sp. NPDC127111]|uniref:glycosyl hydrolase family 18 protein n=1 Tax=Kitasatospora sp. NPDC127111 TaxID=3345363 RepID=UPI00364367F6